jgi:pyridoxal phosphate enzyme (YggS family)
VADDELERFSERLRSVHERIAAAAREAGRRADDVRLIAVSKYASIEQIRIAIEAGQRDFGENYVQDAFEKMDRLVDASEQRESPKPSADSVQAMRWHMIGGLQSNKAARAAERFYLIHTLASLRAAKAISRAMDASGTVCRALVQIHLGGGTQRAGLGPEQAPAFVREVAGLPGLELAGVMGVAPPGEDARRYFAVLRETLEGLRTLAIANAPMRELSAGMSGDFEDAVREGATLVRVGGALFAEES